MMLVGCLSWRDSTLVKRSEASSASFSVKNFSGLSSTGCQYDYKLYEPKKRSSTTSIVLGHGFLRNQSNMRDLSRALANEGVAVITMDFCNMRLWNGHHRRNAQDMRALAVQLDIVDDVVFAGFSAGALAALLAADNSTRAVLALDMVDQANLGLEAIKDLSTPLVGISGPASSCNANGNADPVFNARKGPSLTRLKQIEGISHCDFESPSDWFCELVCSDDSRSRPQIQSDRKRIITDSIEALTPFLNGIETIADT